MKRSKREGWEIKRYGGGWWEKVEYGVSAAAGIVGGVAIATIGGAAVGALCGEILDHIPYLSHAIPEGLYYLTNYINPDAAEYAKTALEGNLDKVGAAIGFIVGLYKSSIAKERED